MKKRILLNLCILILLFIIPNVVYGMTAVINVPEKYSEVNAGEKIYFETEIKWPENTERKDLRLEYSIKDKNDIEIAYLKVLKAIETQASFMDSISIPESTKSGTYKIFLQINDYQDFDQEVITSFKIEKSKRSSFNFYLMLILGFLSIVSVIVVAELSILIKKNSN